MELFADPDALGGLGGCSAWPVVEHSPLLGCGRAEPTGVPSQPWVLPPPCLRGWRQLHVPC